MSQVGPSVSNAGGKRARGQAEFEELLATSLGPLSLIFFLLVCFLMKLPTALAETLAFSAEEVDMIAPPAGRLLAKSKLPAKTKTALLNSQEYVILAVAFGMYGVRVMSVLGEAKHVNSQQNARVQPVKETADDNNVYNGTYYSAFGGLAPTP